MCPRQAAGLPYNLIRYNHSSEQKQKRYHRRRPLHEEIRHNSCVSYSYRLENHNRNLSSRPALVFLVVRIHLHEYKPQAGPLLFCDPSSTNSVHSALDLNCGNGGCFEVHPPGRMGVISRIRRNDNPICAVLKVKQRSGARSASLSSDSSQEENRCPSVSADQSSRYPI